MIQCVCALPHPFKDTQRLNSWECLVAEWLHCTLLFNSSSLPVFEDREESFLFVICFFPRSGLLSLIMDNNVFFL